MASRDQPRRPKKHAAASCPTPAGGLRKETTSLSPREQFNPALRRGALVWPPIAARATPTETAGAETPGPTMDLIHTWAAPERGLPDKTWSDAFATKPLVCALLAQLDIERNTSQHTTIWAEAPRKPTKSLKRSRAKNGQNLGLAGPKKKCHFSPEAGLKF